MKRMIVVAAVLGLGVFTAFAQRGAGQGMGRAGAPPVRPAQAQAHVKAAKGMAPGAQKAQVKAARQDMAAGAQRQQKMAKQPGVNLTPKLAERLTPLLPERMPVEVAAEGFKNNGQFIAALNVSKNLGIPFDLLKARMTGPEAVSLGRAIQELKPALTEPEVQVAVTTAEQQAIEQERAVEPQRDPVRGQTPVLQ